MKRKDVNCPRGYTRARAIGEAVESIEKDPPGNVYIHSADGTRIVTVVEIREATEEDRDAD